MKTETPVQNYQKKFNFSPPQERPFLTNLATRLDTYEERVARFFQWRTGLDYYLAMDQIIDRVIDTGGVRVIDMLADTAVFALRLAGRKAFPGRIYAFDEQVTLLERAKQRAAHLNLQQSIDFRQSQGGRFPLQDGHGDVAVSIFDLHRHPAEEYLAETLRILNRNGYLILAEILEPKSGILCLPRIWRRLHLQFIQKNPEEARAVYYDREEIIELLFKAGFRQIIIEGLNLPAKPYSGVFSLVVATK